VELTKKQRQILDAVVYLVNKGQAPTVREVGALVGLSSPATVQKHLKSLEQAGYLETTGKSRGIRPVRGSGIPIVGRIAAGEPIENIEPDAGNDHDAGPEGAVRTGSGWYRFPELGVDPNLFCPGAAPGDLIGLRVVGESMIEAGIFDGDLVIVRRQPVVEEGEIAAVVVEGEGTLKRLLRGGNRDGGGSVELRPANQRFDPIVIGAKDSREVRVIGKYVGLVRGENLGVT
jgi:repressor LexA